MSLPQGTRPQEGMSPREAMAAVTGALTRAGVPSPAADARWLAQHVLGGPPVLATAPLSADQAEQLARLTERRSQREPLQHLLGQMPFRHLTLASAPGTFVARPETEQVAQAAIDAARAAAREAKAAGRPAAPSVVDLCTGSGAIALAVATEVPGSRVWALELGRAPLELAARNIAALAPQVRLVEGDVCAPICGSPLGELRGSVDVVVSNPPYVPPAAVPRDPEVAKFDPALALYGQGADGLGHVAAVLQRARELLRAGGRVFIEHADHQGPAVVRMALEAGFTAASTQDDLSGRQRYLAATWPGEADTMQLLEPTAAALEQAAAAVHQGHVIALPTDTVYGIGADPFSPAAVGRLLAAKGRGRNFPPPVLIADAAAATALVPEFSDVATRLAHSFWPGALTLILPARPEVEWDLGETNGTVALRVPADATARELLRITGPLAVTSANLHGQAPATTARECADQLGASLALILDGGQRSTQGASTILDLTGSEVRVVRTGALDPARIAGALAGLATVVGADGGHVVPAPQPGGGPDAAADGDVGQPGQSSGGGR